MPSQAWLPDRSDALDLLREAAPVEEAYLSAGSNYVFLVRMTHPAAGEGYAVYKPVRGEAPLSDFPSATLYAREYASYLVSEALGWHLIPPTIVREAGLSMGLGMLQLFIEHDPAQHYFTLKDERGPEMQRIALFDWLTNNADRKAGHVLIDGAARLWCIDQGLTFHVEDKLRTVIWDYQGQPVPEDLLQDVAAFAAKVGGDSALRTELAALLSPGELRRLEERAEEILSRPVFPPPPQWRPYPWPMV